MWLVGLSHAAAIAAAQAEVSLLSVIAPLRQVACVFLATWFAVAFIKRAEENLIDPQYARKPLDKTTAVAIGKPLRASAIITASLVVAVFRVHSGVWPLGGLVVLR